MEEIMINQGFKNIFLVVMAIIATMIDIALAEEPQVTNMIPRQIIIDGKEMEPFARAHDLLYRGLVTNALDECNRIINGNPDNKYARFARAIVFKRLGRVSDAEIDLDYLITNHSDFESAYLERAKLFLLIPMSVDGKHPLLDWLQSADAHKQSAGLEAILEAIQEIQKAKKP
jgi:tetratricopeptide (TPR) repeat protein